MTTPALHCPGCSGFGKGWEGECPGVAGPVAGGVIARPDGEDAVPVRLMHGEHLYDADGRLLLAGDGAS